LLKISNFLNQLMGMIKMEHLKCKTLEELEEKYNKILAKMRKFEPVSSRDYDIVFFVHENHLF